jgi:ABC-type transporter Mla maintaining outer membrane lipid asymmetry ATPase subunit MlaF
MSDASPVIDITGLEKTYGALRPLRVARLRVNPGDRLVLSGFDVGAAETLVNLITGAALPDVGEVHVSGRNTRDIATDTEWLTSLDRFGIVTDRAILLSGLSIAANLALPMTLSIDPMSETVLRQVEVLADSVGIPRQRLSDQAATLTAGEKVRAHVARAVAVDPQVLLLEHPTAQLDPPEAEAFGTMLRALADARQLSVVALSEDDTFARATGGTRLRLNAATGELSAGGFWSKILLRHKGPLR